MRSAKRAEAVDITLSKTRPGESQWSGRIVVGLPHQFAWLRGLLIALIVFNLFDAVFTLIWLRRGMATEANLFVRRLVTEHAPLFMAVKISLVSLGAFLLWRRRSHPLAVIGIFTSFFAYYVLLLHHLDFASWLVGRFTRT